jgi:hypothetical protein
MKNHVHFDESYFKKTISEYQDWELAFVRETAQNSGDAGAKTIEYTIEEDSSGLVTIVCRDDGRGMTKDILLNKFLVMGGSHKDSEDSVGGFGYAKGIILFCHHSYEIKTNGLKLIGGYGRYSDPEPCDYQQGTEIKIVMDKGMSSKYRIESKLREWVSESNLKGTTVLLNGEELEQLNTKFNFKKQTKIGKLQFNVKENSWSSSIWVRMRGMAMFSKSIYTNDDHFEAYIDLDAKSSLECLTANRDGLKRIYDDGLNDLIQYLSQELGRYKVSEMDDFEINSISSIQNEIEGQLAQRNIEEVTPLVKPKSSGSIQERRKARFEDSMENIIEEDQRESLLDKAKKEKNKMAPKIEKILNKLDGSSYPESFLVKIDKLKDKSNQEILKTYNNTVKVLNQTRSKKYSDLWQRIVHKVLDVANKSDLMYLEENGNKFFYGKKSINYGFIISEDRTTIGMCSEQEEKSYILLNPRYARENNYSNKILAEIAIHEVAHLVHPNHSEMHSYFIFGLQVAIDNAKVNWNKI